VYGSAKAVGARAANKAMGRGNVTANLAVTSFTPSADIGGASKKIPTAVGRVCLHDHVDSDAVVSVEFVGGKCSDARCEAGT